MLVQRVGPAGAAVLAALALVGCGSTGSRTTSTGGHTTSTATVHATAAAPAPAAVPAAAVAAVTATTRDPASCFSVSAAARYPGYAVANFNSGSTTSTCGHEVANATFVVREKAGRWKVLNPSGTISCPVHSVPNRIAKALGIPC
jgi:hypothetical protein